MKLQLRLWLRAIKDHHGLQLCWLLPALGLLSGVLGHANDHRLERAVAAAIALAVLTWPCVLWTAWEARDQYKDKSHDPHSPN